MESAHELRLKTRVERELGGLCLKLLPWAQSGLPDRLVVHNGKAYFVETKFRTKRLRSTQRNMRRRLLECGFGVHIVHTREAVDDFIEVLRP